MRIYLRSLILVQIILLAQFGHSQDTVIVIRNTNPTLNGHQFVPQQLISTPFIKSAFQMHMGAEGAINLTIPAPDILPDSIKGLKGDLIFANVGFQYDQRIKDWISFFIRGSVVIRTGTELGTLLAEGLTTLIGGEMGLVFKLIDRPRHQLTGMFSINNYNGAVLNISQFVQDIVDGVPNPSITHAAPALSVGTGANYAFGLTEVVGVTGIAEFQYGENISRGNETLTFKLGTAIDFNWASRGVPVGISIAYLLRSTADFVYIDNSIGHSLAAKLAYTAAPDFVIGIELTSSILPVVTLPDKVNTIGLLASINYYFN